MDLPILALSFANCSVPTLPLLGPPSAPASPATLVSSGLPVSSHAPTVLCLLKNVIMFLLKTFQRFFIIGRVRTKVLKVVYKALLILAPSTSPIYCSWSLHPFTP